MNGKFEPLDHDGTVAVAISDDCAQIDDGLRDIMLTWIRDGKTIRFVREPLPPETVKAALASIEPKPKRPYTRKPKPVRQARKMHATEPATTDFPADARHAQDSKVYLSWSNLSERLKVALSTYRTTPGVVEAYRAGRGVSKTYGVRFNSDPELTWLAQDEIASTAEID
jgi:hypothetical protein